MRRNAFTLIELTIVVMIIGLLASVAVPSFMKSRNSARNSVCTENRRVLDDAKSMWMIDNAKVSTDQAQWKDIVPEYTENLPKCPVNGEYTLGKGDELSYCSVHGSTTNTSSIAWGKLLDLFR